jgi:Alginate export
MTHHAQHRPGKRSALVAVAVALPLPCLPLPGLAQSAPHSATTPWRLEEALGAPAWLSVRGETRVRYETLTGQFRAGGSGGDQKLAFRTLLLGEAGTGPVRIGVELQDSRAELDDAGTPLSTGSINAFDLLQAYARVELPGALGFSGATLKIGRQTLDIASRRVLERVEMANVIFSYTGAHLVARTGRGDELHVVHVSPVGRVPVDLEGLLTNRIEADREEWGRRFWGLHLRRANAFGQRHGAIWAEAFVYRLIEDDTATVQTPNRAYVQPGVRLFRAPARARWDFEVETALRTGTRRETALPGDTRDLRVHATMLHAHLGYTFDTPARVRMALDHDYASGDKRPGDGRFDQFERLFGGRRTDLGNTGIHGPLTPANLIAPGGRVEWQWGERADVRIAYKAAWLDSARDVWPDARLRDPAGASGRFIGHALDSRLRVWVRPRQLQWETGASALLPGSFARRAPRAPGQAQTLFVYSSLTATF